MRSLKMKNVNLLLGVHCHQPVGNFGGVFQEAYEKAYLPFIETISKYPNIKFSLHYSGSLLDWLKEKQPDFLKKVRNFVKNGQIEIIAGGYYEPILPLIDEQDALSQIELLKQAIKELFSYEAQGLWLTERVWEPRLPDILSKGGIRYTIVDDAHFRYASMEPENLSGYYITEEKEQRICLFAGSEKLRYLMPFKLPKDIIEYLKNRLDKSKQDITITFADDGEKFGLWPGTHKWVYKEGWLDSFLTCLEENSDWIETRTFSEYINKNPASGRVYLPCASYREMMEWSDGNFRNFLVKYEEVNNMYRKMWYVSNKIKNATGYRLQATGGKEKGVELEAWSLKLNEAQRHLYMGQDNDAYWHGVFGGIYLHHLRSSVYYHLIEAENIVDSLMPDKAVGVEELDFNLDGNNEIIINSNQQNLLFTPSIQGALFEWDYKPKSLNLTNTIMRRYEKYHARIKEKMDSGKAACEDPLSIHQLNRIKEDVLNLNISYDKALRYSLIEHFIPEHTRLEDFIDNRHDETGDFLNARYEYEIINKRQNPEVRFWRKGEVCDLSMQLEKHITCDKNLIVIYELKNLDKEVIDTMFGIEFNLSVYDPRLSRKAGMITSNTLTISDVWQEGFRINFFTDRKTDVWHFPVETLSDSEAGIEKNYQELCLLFNWKLNLAAQDTWNTKIEIRLE